MTPSVFEYNNMESDSKTCGTLYSGICFDKILSLGKINSCAHTFHFKCIYRWSRISNNCPTCRNEFTEICHFKGSKLHKKVTIHQDSHSTEEDISNSDIEEWQAVCPICDSSSEDFLLVCEGECGCSNVCHLYCLHMDPIPDHWVCRDCEAQESESLADEESSSLQESSSEINSDLDSDPEAEYQPAVESPVLRRNPRRHPRRIDYESESESESEAEGESEGESLELEESSEEAASEEGEKRKTPSRTPVGKPLRRLKRNSEINREEEERKRKRESNVGRQVIEIPAKRLRSSGGGENSGLNRFVADLVESETKKEIEKIPVERIELSEIQKKLRGAILRNQRLSDYDDNRTVQKMKTVIRNYIAGLV